MGVVLVSADDKLSTLGMARQVSGTVFLSWILPFMGVVITLIHRAHQLFPYPNEFLVAFGHRGSDKRGSTASVLTFVKLEKTKPAVFIFVDLLSLTN